MNYLDSFPFKAVSFDTALINSHKLRGGRFIFLVLCLSTFFNTSRAQNYFLWAENGGSAFNDEGLSINIDNQGNIFTTGIVDHGSTFGPYSLGNSDAFITKRNQAGSIVWAKGVDGAESFGICTDSSGNCYITGVIHDTAHFDNFNLVSNGGNDLFMAKYSSSGNFIWAINSGSPGDEQANSIALDANNHLYITGNDSGDFFISKYDTSGSHLWTKTNVVTWGNVGNSLDINDNNEIYITGFFTNFISFDSISLYPLTSGRVPFTVKYNSLGNALWAKIIDSTDYREGVALSTFLNSGCVITGSSYDSLGIDIFVSRYDKNGKLLWSTELGEDDKVEESFGIDVNKEGKIFITGYLGGDSLSGIFHRDIFLTALDSTGNELWTYTTGSPLDVPWYSEGGRSVTAEDNYLYFTGTFKGTADFPPHSLTTHGNADVFVAKMDISDGMSIPEIKGSEKFSLYPNPAKNSVKISFETPALRHFQFFSITGALVKDIGFSESRELNIDISQLPEGLYLLRVDHESQTASVKFVKK